MSFEDKEAELGWLLTRMQNEPADWGELYEQIRVKLNELKAFGMPLPRISLSLSATSRKSSGPATKRRAVARQGSTATPTRTSRLR
jgi:hypothetical protein